MKKQHSNGLSWIAGMFNLAGAYTGPVKLGDLSDDSKALRSDWGVVGNEIRKATADVKSGTSRKAERHNPKQRSSS